jgi:integrase
VKDRIVELQPRALAALARVKAYSEQGQVFRRDGGKLWHPDTRISGAQLNRTLQSVAEDIGLGRRVFLHMIRHSWASWHYAVHKDLKKLRDDGAWESLEMADRYSHLAPTGMAFEILAFWERADERGGG